MANKEAEMASVHKPSQEEEGGQESVSRNGSDAIVETLKETGVELVFGYSGGGTLFVINSLVKHQMPNMCGRTELGAAWMSYGYNRMKRRAASACVFHCVGALHASPVLLAAKSDSTPFFMMDVNLSESLDMREPLQDAIDIYSAMRPVSKYIRKVTTAEDLPLAVRQAVLAAGTGRQGPSVLDLGFQVLNEKTTCVSERLTLPSPPGSSEETLDAVISLIKKAERPVLLVGAGVQIADAAEELRVFAERTGIPIISTSWGGRGVIPDSHPLFGGVMGAFGWISANDIAQRSDLWIAIGTTFSQMTTGAWSLDRPANIVHVDIDPNQLGKIFQPTVGVTGDAKVVLRQLLSRADAAGLPTAQPESDPWIQHMRAAKQEWLDYHNTLGAESGQPINQYYLIRKMSEIFPKGTVVVGDSGGNAFMLYRSFDYQEVTRMPSGSRYMSLGASLPIAIGAKLAAPEKLVVSYHGDGGFFYDFNELSTLSQSGIKVIVIIDNNRCLLANRSGMRMMGFENPWADLPEETDFVGLARALGVAGEQVLDPNDVAPALERALAAEGSYVIDVVTDPDTRVRRAMKDVVPILSDRPPSPGADKHVGPPLEGSWPNRR